MRIGGVARLAVAVLLGAAGCGPAARDVAVWVYEAHRWSSAELGMELSRLPRGTGRLYLSVEDGPRLVLEDPGDAGRVGELLDLAHGQLGLAVEAMLLQDPAWAFTPGRSAARAARVAAFHAARRAAGRPGFASLHFDIEPHTEEAWACGDAAEHRATVRTLQATFTRIAERVREADYGSELRLTAALPWWLGPLSAEAPEAAPAAWLASLDEVVLMVYGDPGGPLVGGSARAVLAKVEDRRLWASLPGGRGVRVGLATYEYRDPAALGATVREVSSALAGRPGFRGVAIFAHGQPFDAPLVTSLEGQVLDRSGRPVAGARIRAGDQEVRSNRCGLFAFRGLPAPAVEVTVEADGFAAARVPVGGLVAGRERRLDPVRLDRAP